MINILVYQQFGEDPKKEAFGFIRNRLQGKLQAWKQNHLSLAGKMVLIKAVAFAIPTYPMNCFKLPVTLCREFDSLIANFWWGRRTRRRKSIGRVGKR